MSDDPYTGWFDFNDGVDIEFTRETVYLKSKGEGPKAVIPTDEFEDIIDQYRQRSAWQGDRIPRGNDYLRNFGQIDPEDFDVTVEMVEGNEEYVAVLPDSGFQARFGFIDGVLRGELESRAMPHHFVETAKKAVKNHIIDNL